MFGMRAPYRMADFGCLEARAGSSGVQLTSVAPCAWGESGGPALDLLSTGWPARALTSRCRGFHAHGPSRYGDALRGRVATLLLTGVRDLQRRDADSRHPARGGEHVVADELLMEARWREVRSWAWKRPSHINLLEGRVVTQWLRELCWTAPGGADRWHRGLAGDVGLGH